MMINFMTQVSAQHFDWGDPSCQGNYDVALACDVLYEPYSVEPVANITPRLLNHRTGRLLLADPSHRTKDNRYLVWHISLLVPQLVLHCLQLAFVSHTHTKSLGAQ